MSGECAHDHDLERVLRQHQGQREVRVSASATLPYYPDVKGAPQNTIIGGATLWVMTQKDPKIYKGVAKFFTFLSSPAIQADWHRRPATCRSPSRPTR